MRNSADHAGRAFRRAGWAVLFAIALNAIAVAALVAQSTDAGTLYKQALRRETLLREELETVRGGAPGGALLERIRVLVESYEDLARLFASSEYSDDSLSQGGMIAADAFAQFGEATDRATALRLLTTLTKQFPNSPLNRQASARTRTLEQARPLAGVKLQEETVRVASLPDPKSASRVKGPEESTPVPAATATPPRMASTTPPAASTTAPAAASESAPRPAAAWATPPERRSSTRRPTGSRPWRRSPTAGARPRSPAWRW